MADGDLIKLYSQRILALAADIPHAQRLEAPDGSATRRSPLCGSMVAVDVGVDDGRLTALGMDVKACALGQASASIMARQAIGRTRDEIQAGRDALAAVLGGAEPEVAAFWPDLDVMTPARDHKNRHASILLAWDGALDAWDQAAADKLKNTVSDALTSG